MKICDHYCDVCRVVPDSQLKDCVDALQKARRFIIQHEADFEARDVLRGIDNIFDELGIE